MENLTLAGISKIGEAEGRKAHFVQPMSLSFMMKRVAETRECLTYQRTGLLCEDTLNKLENVLT